MTSIDTQQLAGKHAFVTGGGRGIGLAISRVLISHGARVTMTSRSIQAQDIEQAMQPHEINRPLSLACDVTESLDAGKGVAHYAP